MNKLIKPIQAGIICALLSGGQTQGMKRKAEDQLQASRVKRQKVEKLLIKEPLPHWVLPLRDRLTEAELHFFDNHGYWFLTSLSRPDRTVQEQQLVDRGWDWIEGMNSGEE